MTKDELIKECEKRSMDFHVIQQERESDIYNWFVGQLKALEQK